MKKTAALILLLLAVCLITCASANSWGLKGDLYRAVESSGDWDDYTAVSNQADDFAVMGSRYHNALFFADGSHELHVYTTAVYQPEDKRPAPKLTVNDDFDLTISYGDNERYTFSDTIGGYELAEATIGDFHIELTDSDDSIYDWRYAAEDGEGTAVFPVTIMLDTFNIRLFPHSAAEVCSINRMHALLEDTRYCLGYGSAWEDPYSPDRRGELLEPKKKGTAPVYSTPSDKAWRAGKGKAAVGTNGSMWVLKQADGEDGRGWACIRYDVSERTQRIGWVLCKDLGLEAETEDAAFAHTPVETIADTFLTDDPDVSQYPQFAVPNGTELTCLGLYNDHYAYVEAKANNGKLSGKGTVVRGFVPVRDLHPAPSPVQRDIMKKAAGVWYADGSTLAGELLTLDADGTFAAGTAGGPDEEAETLEGTWYVTKYDTAEGIYWDEPPYRITLLYDNGNADIYGLILADSRLELSSGLIGGTYLPFDEYDESMDESAEEE